MEAHATYPTARPTWRAPLGLPLWTLVAPLLGVVAIVTAIGKAGPVGVTIAAIILNFIIGLCLLAGALRHHEQRFTLRGVSAAFGVLAVLAVLTLVLPNYTLSAAGPVYSVPQLVFVAVVALALYLSFVFVQTIRHRDYFLPAEAPDDRSAHAAPPTARTTIAASVMLLVALVAVVLLAKALSPTLEAAVVGAGLPRAIVGVAIAAMVLAPESLAAFRAARHNRLQTSLNLAIGSALATIGLTIPVVAMVSLMLGLPLALGIDARNLTLLALSLFVAALSLSNGRTTVLQGIVHLLLFATYLFVTVVP